MVYQCIMANLTNLVFVDTFCSAVRLVEPSQKLGFSETEVRHLLDHYSTHVSEQLVRFLLTLIYHFNTAILPFTVQSVWT
jgi:hypothetical protein